MSSHKTKAAGANQTALGTAKCEINIPPPKGDINWISLNLSTNIFMAKHCPLSYL